MQSKGVCSISRKNLIKTLLPLPFAIVALLYGGGYLSQFIYNYEVWQQNGGTTYGGTAPAFPDSDFISCILSAFRFPYGLYGTGICVLVLALLIIMVMPTASAPILVNCWKAHSTGTRNTKTRAALRIIVRLE